jgi:hypothetical protein
VTVAPGDDDRPDRPETAGPAGSGEPAGGDDLTGRSWRSNPSDDDVDAAFADIVSGLITDSVRRHPSGAAPTLDAAPQPPKAPDVHQPDEARDTPSDRARRRELRRLERAAELAAFQAGETEEQAERDADQEHYTPPDPPPLPRPKLRTVGSVLMILGGILLLARPGILAVAPDLAMVLAVLLIVGGAVLLVTGIWRRRGGKDGNGWDDGAVV